MEGWIKEHIGITSELKGTWKVKKGTNVIGAECTDRGNKGEIMKGKNKLKRSNLYIENDKMWKERKNERKLRAWAKWKKKKDGVIEKTKF